MILYNVIIYNEEGHMGKPFPSGLAEGAAFCDRDIERALLKENIEGLNHTVLVAPRRYGKSSLVKKVMQETGCCHTWIDFLTIASKEQAEKKIAKTVADLIYQLAPDLKKLRLNFQKFFKSLNPDVIIQTLGATLSLHPNFEHMVQIEEALMGLDRYAYALKKNIVIVFDEFQQISLLKEHMIIEAAIRHAVERSKAITYIFSGSNRRLLTAMFSASDRPLYKLCLSMPLERIAAKDYRSFLQKKAQETWHTSLTEAVLSSILFYTERHPFYLNGLCNKLWKLKKCPAMHDVKQAWDWYVNTNRTTITTDLADLSINQKKLLLALAVTPTKEILSKVFSNYCGVSVSSIQQAIDVLLAKDIIFINEQEKYTVLDPAVKYYLVLNQ